MESVDRIADYIRNGSYDLVNSENVGSLLTEKLDGYVLNEDVSLWWGRRIGGIENVDQQVEVDVRRIATDTIVIDLLGWAIIGMVGPWILLDEFGLFTMEGAGLPPAVPPPPSEKLPFRASYVINEREGKIADRTVELRRPYRLVARADFVEHGSSAEQTTQAVILRLPMVGAAEHSA